MVVLSKPWSSFKNAEEYVITKIIKELRASVKLPEKSDIMKIIIRDYTKKTIQDLTGDGYILLQNAFFVNLEMPSFPDLLLLM